MGSTGLEPVTSSMSMKRSSQLSYEPVFRGNNIILLRCVDIIPGMTEEYDYESEEEASFGVGYDLLYEHLTEQFSGISHSEVIGIMGMIRGVVATELQAGGRFAFIVEGVDEEGYPAMTVNEISLVDLREDY